MLLIRQITFLRDAGKKKRAMVLAARHKDILGDDIDRILPKKHEPRFSAKGVQKKDVLVAGQALMICQLLLKYYRALSGQDAKALDSCLFKSPETMSGKDILQSIERKRKSGKAFETIGSVIFDGRTSMRIVDKGNHELEVRIWGMLMSYTRRGKTYEARARNIFRIRRVDAEYLIVEHKKKNMKQERKE